MKFNNEPNWQVTFLQCHIPGSLWHDKCVSTVSLLVVDTRDKIHVPVINVQSGKLLQSICYSNCCCGLDYMFWT